jgi:hypothetical protein
MQTFPFYSAAALLPLILLGADPPLRREVLLNPVTASSAMKIRVESGSLVVANRGAVPGYSSPAAFWASLLDRDGNEIGSYYPGKADAEFTGFSTWDATLHSSQVLTVSGTAWKGQGLRPPLGAGVLAQYNSRSGALIRIVRTDPIQCRFISSGDEGDLWCIGLEKDKANQRSQDYRIVHRFSPQGKLLASYIPRTDIDLTVPVESLTQRGSPEIRVGSSGRVFVWLPAILQVAVIDVATGAFRFYPVPPAASSDASHSVVFLPNGEMLDFLPVIAANDPTSGRYRIHQWLTGGAGSAPVRLAHVADPPGTAIGGAWQIMPAARDVHYAGRSTELVGVDGSYAVLHNRTDRKLIWVKILPD